MPAGYLPVGFELSGLSAGNDGLISFRVVAVRCEDAGVTIDDVCKFAKKSDELAVYPFGGRIALAEFSALFKRMSMKALDKNFAGLNVIQYSDPLLD
jgi:hypothetical protein